MAKADSSGFLGMDEPSGGGGGRFQPLGSGEEEDGTGIGLRPRGPRSDEPAAPFTEPVGPPQGVTAQVAGDELLRSLLPAPHRAVVYAWPYVAALALVADVLIVLILHSIWGDGSAYRANHYEPGNEAYCHKPYDWFREGDWFLIVPLVTIPEALRLRRYCLHASPTAFSAPLADLYASISLLTPESWQRTLAVGAERCAALMAACCTGYLVALLPLMLSSSLLHYPQRLARVDQFAAQCGSDWWFGQVPDVWLFAFNAPVAALIFVPYFVVLHAAEGVRLALQAYVAEFELATTPSRRDEAALSRAVKQHQALQLLLEHAGAVITPALRWLLVFATGLVLMFVTWAWTTATGGPAGESVALFLIALALALIAYPLIRAVERINSFQPKLEKLAFTVGDPQRLGANLPGAISEAAMLREYVREHALELPVAGIVLREGAFFSAGSLLAAFGLVMVPYLVVVMPRFFGDQHSNAFKRDELRLQETTTSLVYDNSTHKPYCVQCGHCGYHGWCQSGLYAGPALEGCMAAHTCTEVKYADVIMRAIRAGQ